MIGDLVNLKFVLTVRDGLRIDNEKYYKNFKLKIGFDVRFMIVVATWCWGLLLEEKRWIFHRAYLCLEWPRKIRDALSRKFMLPDV